MSVSRKHAYVFFSVHERLFGPLCQRLLERDVLQKVSGFCWGRDQEDFLRALRFPFERLDVFSRDVLSRVSDTADPRYLQMCEDRYRVSLNRIIYADRHLWQNRSFDQMLALLEAIFRQVEQTFSTVQPDLVFSENVSCLTSYVHWLIARDRNIPFYCFSESRLADKPLLLYRDGLQDFNFTNERFRHTLQHGLPDVQRAEALAFLQDFRARPVQPKGMEIKGRAPSAGTRDIRRLANFGLRYRRDPGNPTLEPVGAMAKRRLRRLGRFYASEMSGLFEHPKRGERYVLFPLHFQPEASTLVLAPYYLNQQALIEDISKSLPVGVRLYVKEHSSSQGRRPLQFYRDLCDVYGVRLIAPTVPTWPLIEGASAIAVITGTMGWEGVLMKKPVVSFGKVFYNTLPLVYAAGAMPKHLWFDVFRRSMHSHEHDEETLIHYVAALLATSYEGEVQNPATVPRVTDPLNVERLADAFADCLARDPLHAGSGTAAQAGRALDA